MAIISQEEEIIKWAWILLGYSSKRGTRDLFVGEEGPNYLEKNQTKPCLRV